MPSDSTAVEHNYLVALDPDLGFCRLFRTDSVEGAGLSALWSGLGLRAGYDAMIRLNKDRRPIDLFMVCSREGTRGLAFRLFKTAPPDETWTMVASRTSHAEAKECLSGLVAERKAAEAAARDRMLRALDRAGVRATRVPRLSAADRRYLEWLESTGRVAA